MASSNTADPQSIDMSNDNYTNKKIEMVYGLGADAVVQFECGESIRISRSLLAFHSKFFMDTFFGLEPKTQITIKDFDRASFKTFLDCLFGMKDYTLLDALLIYPIAHQYEVKESLDKCAIALKPEHMSENVSRVLNLTTFYNCKELTDYAINFVKTEYGIVNFLENKKYSNLLEPSVVLKLIENVHLNSLVWTLVYHWAKNYVNEHKKYDIRSLFIENGIYEKISCADFESAKAVLHFNSLSDHKLLNPKEILSYLETNTLEFNKKIPDRSAWVKINKGDNIIETLVFKNLLFVSAEQTPNGIAIFISPNTVLMEPENSVLSAIKVTARYVFRIIKRNSKNATVGAARAVWRPDLNFYYCETNVNFGMNFVLSPYLQNDKFDIDLLGDNDGKKLMYKFVVSSTVALEIHSVEITYSFNFPCRILRASLNTDKNLIVDNNLYFTKNVSISKGKK